MSLYKKSKFFCTVRSLLPIAVMMVFVPVLGAEPWRLNVFAARAGILDNNITVNYGGAEVRTPYMVGNLGAWVGLETSFEEYYLGAGLYYAFNPGDRWFFVPSTGIGFYEKNGGLRLGHELEFRSALEIDYQFENKIRLGISFAHYSNAGFGDFNPGNETVKLILSVPIFSDNR